MTTKSIKTPSKLNSLVGMQIQYHQGGYKHTAIVLEFVPGGWFTSNRVIVFSAYGDYGDYSLCAVKLKDIVTLVDKTMTPVIKDVSLYGMKVRVPGAPGTIDTLNPYSGKIVEFIPGGLFSYDKVVIFDEVNRRIKVAAIYECFTHQEETNYEIKAKRTVVKKK